MTVRELFYMNDIYLLVELTSKICIYSVLFVLLFNYNFFIMLIEYLLQKLKIGDARSINLNAIPWKLATRFDIADFSDIDPFLLGNFFEKLLNHSTFKFKLDLWSIDLEDENINKIDKLFDDNQSAQKISKKKWWILLKRLNTIIASEEDEFQEHWVRSFWFWYPLLIKKISKDFGEDKLIISPVFIRKLTIERLKSSKYTYQISRDDEMWFGLNEVLLGNLEANDKIIIKQIWEDITDSWFIDEKNLLLNLNSLLTKCWSKEIYYQLWETERIPSSKKELEEIYQKSWLEKSTIFWWWVFGLYRTLKEKIIEDTKKLPIDIQIDNNLEDQAFDFEHPYWCVSTDPSQQIILDNLDTREWMVIQWPPWTWKSQTITAIITNALDNNKKCLVVCEKRTALEVIKNNLSKIGLWDMCALIEDVHSARKDIVELVRNKQEYWFWHIGFKNNEYQSTLDEINLVVNKNSNQRELLQKDYFNKNNRKSLVWNFLQKSKQVENDLIDDLYDDISEYIHDHSYDNYNNLIKIIQQAEILYFVWSKDIFLNRLKKAIFIDSWSYISSKNQYEKFIKQLKEGKENFENEINIFKQILKENKETYDVVLDSNLRIQVKFMNNWVIWEYINKLIENYNIIWNEKWLLEINSIINEYKEKKPISSNEMYDSFINPKTLKKNIDLFEKEINNQKTFHDKIRSLNIQFIENIWNIVEKIEELQWLSNSILSKHNDAANKLWWLYSLKHNVLSVFSHKHKEILNDQKIIIDKYEKLKQHIYNQSFNNITNQLKSSGVCDTVNALIGQLNDLKRICDNCSLNELSNKLLNIITYDEKIDNKRDQINMIVDEINDLILEYLDCNKPHQIKSLSNLYDQFSFYEKLESDLLAPRIELEKFYDWINFYDELTKEQKTIIDIFSSQWISNWHSVFDIIRLKEILLSNDVNLLPKNDHDILKLYGLVRDLKDHQIKWIKFKRKEMAENEIRKLKSKWITIQSLYNKRWAPWERRNSLRRIIATDFDLFTNIFPIVLVSPQVCSSILPLEKDLFDIVLFDEASQIRLEDVMSAMYRGKQKIICWDQHQMPPSNFFASSNMLLEVNDDDIEDNDDDIKFSWSDMATQLANSESLLDYAEKKWYFQYMLKIHYRSEHPILIDFSNHAFYWGRLKALPNKKDYTPISFYEVDGQLNKWVNEIEALKVIELLQNILSDKNIKQRFNWVIPSIGIATFNMYQRNYIRELIQKIKYENTLPELAEKLDHVNLFVKNLDTIQWDERDIIIISTTFAKKGDGRFAQNYWPINQSKWYRLLNVMITRAKKEVYLITSIPSEIYTQFEERLRNSKSETKHWWSLLHAYISYCKAVHENNETLRISILEKISWWDNYKEQEEWMTESPFEEEVLSSLCDIIDPARIKLQYKIWWFRIDMIILSKKTNKPLIAIECDWATYHSWDMAYCNDIFRQDILEWLWFIFHRIRSSNRWRDRSSEENKLKIFLESLDEI